jgi:hypothetical protein
METKSRVQWVQSYATGLERCKDQGKPMLLDFFKDG